MDVLQSKDTAKTLFQVLQDGLATLLQQEAAHTRKMQHHGPDMDGAEQALEQVSCCSACPRFAIQLQGKDTPPIISGQLAFA